MAADEFLKLQDYANFFAGILFLVLCSGSRGSFLFHCKLTMSSFETSQPEIDPLWPKAAESSSENEPSRHISEEG